MCFSYHQINTLKGKEMSLYKEATDYIFLFILFRCITISSAASACLFFNLVQFPYSCSMLFDFIVYHLLHLVLTQRVSALCEFLCMWRSFLLILHIIHYARLAILKTASNRITSHRTSFQLIWSHHITSNHTVYIKAKIQRCWIFHYMLQFSVGD